jgi:hypothetical protein
MHEMKRKNRIDQYSLFQSVKVIGIAFVQPP